jgi:DNA-binding YbaB/EbfC family protein
VEEAVVKGGLGNLMKQAQRMQAEMEKAQQELAELEVQGQSGGGMVTVVMTGRHELRQVTIDDAVFGDDKEMVGSPPGLVCRPESNCRSSAASHR